MGEQKNIMPVESTKVNKRIDFDQKTLKRIKTMMPIYQDELPEGASPNEIMSYVVKRAIDLLFEQEFKKKIEEL